MTERTDYKTMAGEIAGDVEAIRKLYVENHELRRTRSEAEAAFHSMCAAIMGNDGIAGGGK